MLERVETILKAIQGLEDEILRAQEDWQIVEAENRQLRRKTQEAKAQIVKKSAKLEDQIM